MDTKIPDGVESEITSKGWLQATGVFLYILVLAAIVLCIVGFDTTEQGVYGGLLLATLAGFPFGFAVEAVKAARKGL